MRFSSGPWRLMGHFWGKGEIATGIFLRVRIILKVAAVYQPMGKR